MYQCYIMPESLYRHPALQTLPLAAQPDAIGIIKTYFFKGTIYYRINANYAQKYIVSNKVTARGTVYY